MIIEKKRRKVWWSELKRLFDTSEFQIWELVRIEFIDIGERFYVLLADSHSLLWLPEFPGGCLPFCFLP